MMHKVPVTPTITVVFVFGLMSISSASNGNDDSSQLAKELANPIANLISLPMQSNFDQNVGLHNKGKLYTLNIQPVIPISINDKWNIISRTILPIIKQHDIINDSNQNGIGDVLQSAFFSPKAHTSNGWTWGAGPVFLLPTASNKYLGSKKFGIGPTIVILNQKDGWTYGGLANHINSISGDAKRADISATFMQPFLSYITMTSTTFSLNTESTYDWNNETWAVPINLSIAQLFKASKQPMQLSFGVRYWAQTTNTSPSNWAVRITYTLLFPKSLN